MSESENQEPVCSSDSSGDPEVVGSNGEDGEACNEAEASEWLNFGFYDLG